MLVDDIIFVEYLTISLVSIHQASLKTLHYTKHEWGEKMSKTWAQGLLEEEKYEQIIVTPHHRCQKKAWSKG